MTRFFCFALLLVVVLPLSLAAQDWEALDEPFSGSVFTVVETPYGIVAGTTDRGMILSTDDGRTWRQFGHTVVGAVPLGTFSDSSIFGIIDDGVGRVWLRGDSVFGEALGAGLTGDPTWGAVTGDDIVYMVTRDGFFRSVDKGVNFTKLSPQIDGDGDIFAVAVGGGDTVGFVADGRGFVSADRGETFLEITDSVGLPIVSLAFDRSGRVMVGAFGNMYVSTDFGVSFDSFALQSGIPLFLGTLIELESGEYVVPTLTGRIFRISNDGRRIREIDIPLIFSVGSRRLSNGTILIADLGTGIWRSDDASQSFDLVGVPGGVTPQEILQSVAGDLIVRLPNGAAVSSDQGETWEYLRARLTGADGIFPEQIGLLLPHPNGTLYGFGLDGSVVGWRPDGRRDIAEDTLKTAVAAGVVSQTGAIVVAGENTGRRSVDDGLTWQVIDVAATSMVVGGDGAIWATTDTLRVSRDDGQSFADLPGDHVPISSIHVDPRGNLYAVGDDDHLVSTDNGMTWNPVELPCNGSEYYSVEDIGGAQGIGLISDCGAHFWDARAAAWRTGTIELPEFERTMFALALTDEYLVAGGVGGLWRTARNFPTLSVEGAPVASSVLFLR